MENNNVIESNKTTSQKEVRIIGFIQDDYETKDDLKYPLPEGYLNESNFPFHVMEEMKDKKNSWCDKMGNIHFSKKYIPEPYIGNDNEVYLHLGDLTMKKKKKFSKLMLQGLKLLEKVA